MIRRLGSVISPKLVTKDYVACDLLHILYRVKMFVQFCFNSRYFFFGSGYYNFIFAPDTV